MVPRTHNPSKQESSESIENGQSKMATATRGAPIAEKKCQCSGSLGQDDVTDSSEVLRPGGPFRGYLGVATEIESEKLG